MFKCFVIVEMTLSVTVTRYCNAVFPPTFRDDCIWANIPAEHLCEGIARSRFAAESGRPNEASGRGGSGV